MEKTLLYEKYPIVTLRIGKAETAYQSVDLIIDFFKQRIDAHRCARFIATFDHFAHTRSLPEGNVDSALIAAKNIVFCFGLTLPEPQVLAVRPRSIGVAETAESFVVSFMEAPMPVANSAMEAWASALIGPVDPHEQQRAAG